MMSQRCVLLVGLLLSCAAMGAVGGGPRGSSYSAYQGAADYIDAPILANIIPQTGMKEGGTNLTITGAGFKRTTTLRVRFAATDPKTEIDIVSATYIDGSTIVVPAPERETAHISHVSVTNDGATYSALPMSTVGGDRTYLHYTSLCTLPSGEWSLDNSTFSACGQAETTVLLDGVFRDGAPDGTIFYDGPVHCSLGSTVRTTWSHHTTPEFFEATSSTTSGSDRLMVVHQAVDADYDMRVTTNVTYEVMVHTTTSQFKWRKYSGGMYGSGTYTDGIDLTLALSPLTYELDLGVKISFPTATGKTTDDYWTFKSMTKNPHIVEGEYVNDRIVRCPVPAYEPTLDGPPMAYDADPWKVGQQHEIKISNRGNNTFSPPTYTNAADGRSVTGATETHGKGSTKAPFNEDIRLFVQGRYVGEEEVVYEIVMTSTTAFKWRKYLYHTAASGSYTSGFTVGTDPQVLDLGVYVKWATTSGKATGDKWSFVAYRYWSTPFSPVAFTDTGIATTGDDAGMVIEGVYTGTASYTYEIETQVDFSTFSWRKYAYGAAASGAWQGPLSLSTAPVSVDSGITVRWKTQYGKQNGDLWTFDAFTGHVITYLGQSYISTAIAGTSNVVGDPRTPTVTGSYMRDTTKTFRVAVSGSCTTSCSQFKWRVETATATGAWSADQVMASAPMILADGLFITWGITSGYQHGNEYAFIAKPMPTSFLPVYPVPPIGIAVTGTYHESHDVPTHDLVYTLMMTSGSTFKWRKNTEPFSGDVTITSPAPMVVGTQGLNLTFAAASGFATGARYIVSARTHIPRITNVTTLHYGNRHLPVVGRAVADSTNYKRSNVGSLVGDVVPYANNNGIHSLTATPTEGDSRAAVVSDTITAGTTPGYFLREFPEVYVEILGNATVGAVSGTRPNDMLVSGTYTGTSSLVYEVQAFNTSHFQFRTWAKGSTSSSAGSWNTYYPFTTSSSSPTSMSNGLSAYFTASTFVAGTAWTFTADYGHSFKYREASASRWSPEVEITGGEQALSGGVSLVFGALSGYTTGDNFRVRNRTVDAWGTYWGKSDATYFVNMTGDPAVGAVRLERASGSATTGLAATMTVSGTYNSSVTYSYEVVITDGSSTPTKFKWRKYLRGYRSGAGPYSSATDTTLSAHYLDDGLSVSWGSVAGHTAGDSWFFTAHHGDSFIWKKGGTGDDADAANWSTARRISHVGLVEKDSFNVGAQAANVDILSFGAYTGSHDATVVIEMLSNGKSFRWKKGPYDTHEGRASSETVSTREGAHEYAAVDSANEAYVEGGGADIVNAKLHAEAYGQWSAPVTISADWPIHLVDGVWVQFSSATGWSMGDMFYIPAKTTTHHELSDGVFVTFGSTSGFAVGDQWSIPVYYAYAARGPMNGNTEVVVHGSGFLPGDKLKCKLHDDRTDLAILVDGQYDSPNRIRCRTDPHPRDLISDPEFTGLGQTGLSTGGVYTGGQDSVFYVEATGSSSFRWRQQEAYSSPAEASTAWSAAVPTATSFTNLTDGVRVKFAAASGYTAGDTWVFKAVHWDPTLQKETQLGSLRPGVLKKVYVSNDDGTSWSKDDHGLSTFLYSDVFVSVSGNDAAGDGTCANPYRTIMKAVTASLDRPRSWYQHDSLVTGEKYMGATDIGLDRHINRDQIMLAQGRYEGTGNNGIAPLGKMLIVTATARAEAVIDCSMTDNPDVLHMADRNQPLGPTHRGSVTFEGVNVESCYNRRTYTLPTEASFGRSAG